MILAAYIVLPVLILPCFFIRKKALSCLICGVLMFAFLMLAASENQANTGLYGTYRLLSLYPVSMMSRFSAPVGFLFPAKLLSMLFPEPAALTAVLAAVFSVGTMKYIYRSCEVPVFAALLAVCGGFMIFAASDPCVFTAVMISAYSFRYASQKRFLRFAAPVLLAACFCFDAVLLLPLYLIFLIPPGIFPLLGGAAVCGLALFLGFYHAPFDLLYGETFDTLLEGLSPAVPVILGVLCLLTGLMSRMLVCPGQTRGYIDTMITLLFTSAFLSLICIYDIRYLTLLLMCAFPSLLTLGGTLLKTAESLAALTFREKKRPVLIGLAVFTLLLLGGWYGCILAGGGEFLAPVGEAAVI